MYSSSKFFSAFVIVLVLVGVQGQVKDPDEESFSREDDRFIRGLISCACSPSGRGIARGASDIITKALTQAKSALTEGGDGDPVEKRATAITFVGQALEDCVGKHGYEACINSAANSRARFDEALCQHDSITGKNVIPSGGDGDMVTLGKCSTDSKYFSKDLGPLISTSTKTPAPASKAPSKSATPVTSKPIPVPVPPVTKPSSAASKKPVAPASKAPVPSSSSSAEPDISVSASPSCSANATETKKKPCIATQWLAERGLVSRALRHSTGTAEVLCTDIAGLPCGTPGHLLREAGSGTLKTYAEICSVRKCFSTKVEVSQLGHHHDWSIFEENGFQLTALSAHPDSTTYSPSRLVARFADCMNRMGLGFISNSLALIPHYVSDAVTYARLSGAVSS